MFKRGKKGIGLFEISLMILSSFAIAFILQENLVRGFTPSATVPKPGLLPNPSDSGAAVAAEKTAAEAAAKAAIEAAANNVIAQQAVVDAAAKNVLAATDAVGRAAAEKVLAQETAKLTALQATATANADAQANLFLFKLPAIGTGSTAFFAAHLIEGVVWGGVLAIGIKVLGPMLGLSDEASNAASLAAFAGVTIGKIVYGAVGPQGFASFGATASGGGTLGAYSLSLGIGAVVAIAIFIAMYKTEKKKLVNFQCLPYEPPLGGANCEVCNQDPFRPCSEYRCRSLGQACQLLNPGTNEERCTWVSPKDVVSPTIQPWPSALKPAGLSYIPDNTIRPPNRGVKIISGGKQGCLPAFTPLEFGVITDEPSQCKIDYTMTKTFDEMQFFFGGTNYYQYNHTQKMKLPGPSSNVTGELAPELKNDGSFSLFSRCRDANGNENVDAFVFNFCVDQSPDTTPPVVEGTSIVNNGFVRFNADQVPIEVYVNEPAECKWSRMSKSYDDMENKMSCATQTYQINANLNYACQANLTGIKNQEDNTFYFRCKDQPDKQDNERNVMVQSYPLTLKGTRELNIVNVGPNSTIFGNTDTVPVDLTVKTDDGAEEGKAICYFSATGVKDSYIAMFESNNFMHKQTLDLVAGSYEYFFRCVDSGGNTAEAKTSFNVVIDKSSPVITRAYKEEGLKMVTNEDAQCVYSLKDCNYVFEEGLPLIYSNPSIKTSHFTEWKNDAIYYIKCQDLYKNQPSPNTCNIVVKSVDLVRK